jgi:aryl-alcohol dehydrogenase-like predicted oxidoreductase
MTTHTDLSARRELPGTDLAVAPFGFGGNVIGFNVDEPTSFELLDAYVERGGNLVDTADSYAWWAGRPGISEEVLGRWLRSRGNRDDVLVCTKVGQLPGQDSLRPDVVRAAVEGSLRRLQTDRIDLYYAHQDHGEPLRPTVEVFDELVREGKVRHIAASNFTGARLSEAIDVAHDLGLTPFAALQPHYSLLHRVEVEGDLAPVCDKYGLGTLTWGSLASGYLTGKYRLGRPDPETPRTAFVDAFRTTGAERVLDTLESVALGRGVHPAAVALAWLATRPTVVAPLVSVTSLAQLDEVSAMAGLRLGADELERLDAASSDGEV